MRATLFILAAFLGGGCARFAPVPFLNPGPAELQQARALHYDPYPSPEMGPEVLGGRPEEFERPPHEPAWVQQRAPLLARPPIYFGR